MLDTITTIATGIGYGVLTVFALLFTIAVYGVVRPWEPSDTDSSDTRDAENTINAIIEEELPEPEQYDWITTEPKPITGIDWSQYGPEPTALDDVLTALRDSHTVHPYAQSPGPITDRWQWSDGHAGVYAERPTFYAVADGDRVEVTPDLSTWDGWDTDEYEIEPAYTAGDSWEREHVRD